MNLPARRTRENAVLTGVCAGLARRWGVDANLLRIALIILSFASGLGLVLYGVGYLVLPTDDATPAPVRRLLPFTKDWPLPALVLTLTAVGFVVFGMLGGWSGVGLLPVLVALGIWYAASRRSGRPVTSPDPTPFERAAEAWRLRLLEHQSNSGTLAIPAPATASFAPAVQPSPAPSELARRPRPRNNRLWWLALALMAVGCTAVALVPIGAGVHLAGLNYLAVVLISLGVTLLVGTWLGRPRLMGLAAVFVMVATGITWVAQSPHTAGVVGVADQSYAFTTADDLPESISLTAGALDLDLTQLALTDDATMDVDLGAGDMVVRLPKGVNSLVTWSVGIGEASVTGEEQHEGANFTGSFERHVDDDMPTVTIAAKLGAGSLEVRP
ncbi:MAG: PspC domain-containing protein [Propionibacteriaceae bacterium]|nr:PspC domain-containing protein [Propionibacteriaceae bacterium]